jgi:predicted RNase H-like HicB family nuclease
MRYIVMIRRTSTGYSVDVPDVPGCVATGMTVEHARQQIAEAIQGHLEVMSESGEDAPTAKPRLDFMIDDDMGEEYCTWVETAEAAENATRGRTGVATKKQRKRRQP